MKQKTYRSADFWKEAIMKMPDNSFFELLRCVFGKIKTPFNKQQLLNDLETFLLREDIQKTIASYIDKTDAKIITAIALFGEPVPAVLENFFADEYSYAQLQDIFVNLEERFIIYRFTEEKIRTVPPYGTISLSRLALNPLLKPALTPFSASVSALFPVIPEKSRIQPDSQAGGNSIVINELMLAALYSFILKRGASFFRSEGVIRKKIIEDGKTIFPNVDLKKLLGAHQVLGLFYAEENNLIPDKKYFNDFCLLSPRERMEYFAAALLVYGELSSTQELLPPVFRVRIREIVIFIHAFINSLKPNSQYNKKSLSRIIEVIKAQTEINIKPELLFENLEKTGLLIKISDDIKQAGEFIQNKTKNKNTPVIVMETGSSILAYPEINFSDAITLASVLNICETGAAPGNSVVRFELDRDSAVRAFDNNLDAGDIIELLTKLSGGKKDETLIWNLKDWEQRYSEVILKKGVILKLSESRRYLTETFQLSELIAETLAPGIYLLNENATDDAAGALQRAGIDIISQRKEKKEAKLSFGNYFSSITSRGYDRETPWIESLNSDNAAQLDNLLSSANARNQDSVNAPGEPNAIKNKYQSALEKIQMGKAEKDELTARINRKLILCEEQLKDAEIRYEKLEARHLDYAGKQNIAKQAIATLSSVEVVRSFKGKEERIFGIPRTLEKDGNDLILVIDISAPETNKKQAAVKSDNTQIRIPLAKISLLRRIKKSIFEK